MPTFSIIVATHNRPRQLARCLEHIRAQTGDHAYEVIVVDDGSGTQTARLLAPLAGQGCLRVIRQKQQGWGAARLAGARTSDGVILVFLDDDCLAPTGWLAAYANAYTAHPEASGIAGALRLSQRWNVAGYKQYLGHLTYFDAMNSPLGSRTDQPGQCWYSYGGNRSFRREIWLSAAADGVKWYGDDTLIDRRLREQGAFIWYTPDAWVEHDYFLSLVQRMRSAYRYTRTLRFHQDIPVIKIPSVRGRVSNTGLLWYWFTQPLVRAAGWIGKGF